MTKLANPWKCDNPSCGILRENDANHWLILMVFAPGDYADGRPRVTIAPWDDRAAEAAQTKHACGIDCGLKIAAALIEANFFKPSASRTLSTAPQTHPGSARKEGGNE